MNIQEMHSWFDVLQDKGDSPYFTTDEKTQFLNRAQTKFVNENVQKYFYTSGAQPENNAIPYNTMESVQAAEDVLGPLLTYIWTSNSRVLSTFSSTTPMPVHYGRFKESTINYYLGGMLETANNVKHRMSTWNKVKMISIISVAFSQGPQMRYVRFSEYMKNKNNHFKGPTSEDPIYSPYYNYGDGQQWVIAPATVVDGSTIRSVWTDPSTSSFYTHANIPAANMAKLTLSLRVVRTPLEMRYDPTTFTTTPASGNLNVSCELPDYTHDEIMAIALDDAGVASRDEALMRLNTANKDNLTSTI
tara:strand:- start:301 stop:1209 length:909 start_codon:yes stop_codon:yes gene_type:complete